MIFTIFLLDWKDKEKLSMKTIKLFRLAERYHELFPKQDMLAVKRDGKMREYSTDEYINTTNNIAYGLLNIGIQKMIKFASFQIIAPSGIL